MMMIMIITIIIIIIIIIIIFPSILQLMPIDYEVSHLTEKSSNIFSVNKCNLLLSLVILFVDWILTLLFLLSCTGSSSTQSIADVL